MLLYKNPSSVRFILILVALIVLAGSNLLVGSADLRDLPPSAVRFILWELRTPEVLTALMAGIALSLSGLAMQTLLGNPLADPSLVGITAGASLGSGLVYLGSGMLAAGAGLGLAGGGLAALGAFAGALLAALLLLACSAVVRGRTTLLLVGVMMSFALSSVVGVLSFYAAADGVKGYVMWGLGTLGGVQLPLAAAALAAVAVLALLMGRRAHLLNALLLGPSYARGIGLNVRALRTRIIIIVSLMCAVATALCGPIAFVGLAVPHAARLFFRTADHRLLVPACILLGAATMLLCRLLCVLPALLWEAGVLPVNVLTPLIGAPVVIVVLLHERS